MNININSIFSDNILRYGHKLFLKLSGSISQNELSHSFSLNLRNGTEHFIHKMFCYYKN